MKRTVFTKHDMSTKSRTEKQKDVVAEAAKLANTSNESRSAMAPDDIIGTAELAKISCEFSGPMAVDELDIAEKLSVISMTEEDQRQVLEELENL